MAGARMTPQRPAGPPLAGQAAEPLPPCGEAATPGVLPGVPDPGQGTPGNTPSLPRPGSITRGGEGTQFSTHQEQRAAWRKAIADQGKARRNRRGKRPGALIVGVRAAPRGDEQ